MTTNSLLYTDLYLISQLSTADEDRVLQCNMKINASTTVTAIDYIKLNVTGK